MTRSLIIAWLLMWCAGVCDYMMQAQWFGWWLPWPITSTGVHLVWWLDWLPHDWWHVVEAAHNALYLSGAGLAGWTLRDCVRPWLAVLIVAGMYVASRGLSSSLILHLVR